MEEILMEESLMNECPSVLLIGHRAASNSPSGHALARLTEALRGHGYHVLHALTAEDGLAAVKSNPGFGAVGIDYDSGGDQMALATIEEIIGAIRARCGNLPVFLIVDKTGVTDLPLGIVREVREYIHLLADTPVFIANRIHFAVRQYRDALLPPYFKALKNFVEAGDYYWDCPGHMGGVAYLKHPVGREFFKFFGENIMRADIGIATGELGDWLEHAGPPREAEERAAKIFGADWTFFVVSGSSTSNRIVTQGAVGAEEIVLVDRNCHKSLNHALTLARARPVYLTPTRNGYGMIGPIPPERLASAHVKALIAASPLARGAAGNVASYAAITNCTYDGFCYDVERVTAALGASVPRIHFDEAWYAYAKFHPLYRGRFAMGVSDALPDRPLIFAVQSTHKMLPAWSMASMIHVKRSARAPLDYWDFNDAFMMHGTTSPFYPLIASIDVAAAMMAGASGESLMQEAIEDAIAFRKAVASVGRRIKDAEGRDAWFFGVFQPDEVVDPESGRRYLFEDAPMPLLSREPRCWTLEQGAAWHGFGDAEIGGGYCLLDPVKVTILCPGIGPDGAMHDSGIPGYVLTRFLDSRRTEIARTGDYTVLVLFSVGTSKGKWGTLLESLLEFKRLHDEGATVAEAIPDLVVQHPGYGGITLAALCRKMHERMWELRIPTLLLDAVNAAPVPALSPAEAFQKVVRLRTEPVRVADLAGRAAASMIVPYPPGIPVLMPGERLPAESGPIMDYLLALQTFGQEFPGFEHEVHGIHTDAQGNFWVRAVVEENRPPMRRGVDVRHRPAGATRKARA